MKRQIFWSVFFTVFLDGRSTNLLRLFSGNLPAMFLKLLSNDFSSESFDFSSSKAGKTGSAQRALSSQRAFHFTSLQICDSQILLETYDVTGCS